MTQEEEQLLLKDLCARLFYGVKVATTVPAVKFGVVSGISTKGKITVEAKNAHIVFECTQVKPYLRSLSSMTEEEKIEYEKARFDWYDDLITYDWLNAHHFDYRGLIDKDLALKAPKEMYLNG